MKNKYSIKKKNEFWRKMRARYRLSFFNESSLDEEWSINLSKIGAIIFFAIATAAIVSLTIAILVFTPIRQYLPGYLLKSERVSETDRAIQIDSLDAKIAIQEQYIMNVQSILSGTIKPQNIPTSTQIKTMSVDSLIKASVITDQFIEEQAEKEKYLLTTRTTTVAPTQDMNFNSPTQGVIKTLFNPDENKFGVSILPVNNNGISACLNGSIISIQLNSTGGYTIIMQHDYGFISVYRNCASPLLSVGEKAKSGEKIAQFVQEENGSPLLFYFELWLQGNAVNPKEYINF